MFYFCSLLAVFGGLVAATDPLPSCQIFSDNQCSGNQIDTPDSFDARKWFTPSPNDADYRESFQDFSVMAAHVHLTYVGQTAVAEVIASHRDNQELSYSFNGELQSSPKISFDSTNTKSPISVTVYDEEGRSISLDDVDLKWNHPSIQLKNPSGDYRTGQKGAIAELFMWPYDDVAAECEYLGKAGYLGAKLFPAQEQVMSSQTYNGDINPWFFAYQPVSYKLQGRFGSRDDLRLMIDTCRSRGVRLYADAVINHMSGGGNDANPNHRNSNNGYCTNWPNKNSSLNLVNDNAGPSPYYTQCFAYTYGKYTNLPPSQEFPAANLGPTHFHCERPLNSWNDPLQLNAGWLSGLVDVNTELPFVQARIADYLTDLLSIGFSGFRMDAAKHVSPDDLVEILTIMKDVNLGGALPDDFIAWLEVLLGGEADMLMCNGDSGYNYGIYLENALYSKGWSSVDVNKIKIWNSGYPKEPEKGYCTISPVRNAIQNDDADQQTSGSTSRDMGDCGCVLVINCDANRHKSFETKLFSDPYGAHDNNNDYPIRLVLSSYYWQGNSFGVPDGQSDCATACTMDCTSCKTTSYSAADRKSVV